MLVFFGIGIIVFLIIFIFYTRYIILMLIIPKKIAKAKELLEKDEENALRIMTSIVQVDRGNPEANWILANIYIKRKQYILAQLYLNEILHYGRFTPTIDEITVREKLAFTYEAIGEFNKALSQYYILINSNKLTYECIKNAIKLSIDSGNFKEANNLILRGKELYPEKGEIDYFSAILDFKKGNITSSEKKLKKAIEKGFNEPEVFVILGKIYFISQKYKLALEALNKLPENYLNSIEIENIMGESFYYLKNYKSAILVLEKLVNELRVKDKLKPEILYILGCAYEGEGELDKALNLWNEIQEKFPFYSQAKEKISFYQEAIISKKIKEFIVAPVNYFLKASENLIDRLNYTIKNCIYVDDKTVEYLCISHKDVMPFNLYLFSITRMSIPINTSYINQKLLLLPRYRAKYLVIVAPHFSEDGIRFAELNSVFIYKFDIYEKFDLI